MTMYKKAIDMWYKNDTTLRCIKLCKFLTAHYFLTSSNKFVKCAHVCYCIALSVVAVYGAFTSFPYRCIEFVLSVIISLVTADEYFFRYFRATETLDVVMGIKSRSLFDNRVRCLVVVTVFLRVFFIYCNYSQDFNVIQLISFNIPLMNQRLDSLVVIIIIYTVLTRMKFLRRRLERNPVPVNIVNKNSVMYNIKEVRRCLLDYNNLLDNFHDVYQEMQFLMCLVIMYCVPKTISFNCRILRSITLGTLQFRELMQELEIIEGFVLICLPSLIADMIRHEVEKIKKALFRQAITCSDVSLRYELQLAYDYVTRRPFNFVLFGAVSADINVPISLISLCITYIIVIMQFSHLNYGVVLKKQLKRSVRNNSS